MKRFLPAALTLSLTCVCIAAAAANFDGEYNTKTLLHGAAVFEFSIHQMGNALEIGFDAANSDAHGATPDATGSGKVTGGNMAQFTWKDSRGNTGTGTIQLTANGCDVSLKATNVRDAACLQFYNQPLNLKRVGKK